MKNIYIIDESRNSLKNGIGTFLQEFLFCVERMDTNICLVSFNSEQSEFSIEEGDKISEMRFPVFPSGNFMTHPEVAIRFFRLYIKDSSNNVFLINYSPCIAFLQLIREYFPLSKIMYIIHDLSWTSVCLGDKKEWKASIKVSGDDVSEKERWLINAFEEEKKMCNMVDIVVCLSLSTFNVLKEIYKIDEKLIRLIPNGLRKKNMKLLDKDYLRQSVNIDKAEKVLLFVGRTTKVKGFSALIEAFRLVLKKVPNARLIIAGAIVDFTSYGDISSRITYLGHIKPEHLRKWYRISDIGVISSYSEQCSYAGIEMMQAGLPIVSSDAFGVVDMFHDGINAKVASIGNRKTDKEYIQNMAKAVLDLIESEILCAKLKITERELASSIYGIRRMKNNYQKLIDGI
ncbi:glycosyltransferase [uncultured Bacteroides sp.]|uniref:glycosyltransferase n=1 Tax=uncultured Bacteroides sp. TaxID=162156 RepID=UPI0025DA3BCC|nr:glycosyltransferase [uncultured Bacteroides sp.]